MWDSKLIESLRLAEANGKSGRPIVLRVLRLRYNLCLCPLDGLVTDLPCQLAAVLSNSSPSATYATSGYNNFQTVWEITYRLLDFRGLPSSCLVSQIFDFAQRSASEVGGVGCAITNPEATWSPSLFLICLRANHARYLTRAIRLKFDLFAID